MEKSFVTFVSHEMRSPLVVIRQYIEALRAVAGERLDADVLRIIERCSERIQGLESLVEHWLDISKIGEGSFVWKKEPLDLGWLVGRGMEEMLPLCREKGITLSTELPDRQFEVLGDPESLLRVLTNIIGNAIKYTPEAGVITLAVGEEGNRVTLSISDTGSGIPADKLPFIFEPFYRVKGKEERHRGSGLGLTFCKKIMDLHGGSISVSSVECQGTSFILKFLKHLPDGSGKNTRSS
jgi:signal transduction histidine kinase